MPYHEPMLEPEDERRRIAFFGGSFDPPHLGHIGVARAAQMALRLDTVLFAPVGVQPLKPLGSSASFEDRIAMTELAIKGLPQFAISYVDAPDPSGTPNYTADTLLRLRLQFPSATLFNLMGADSLLGLRRWHRGAEIPFIAPLIVASRPGQRLQDLAAILPEGLTIAEDKRSEPTTRRKCHCEYLHSAIPRGVDGLLSAAGTKNRDKRLGHSGPRERRA